VAKAPRFASREEYEAWKRERSGASPAAVEAPPAPGAASKCGTCGAPLPYDLATCAVCRPDPIEAVAYDGGDSGLELMERPPRRQTVLPPLAEEPPPLAHPEPPVGKRLPPEPSEEEQKAIGAAVAAGGFSALMTAGVSLYAMSSGGDVLGLSAAGLVDAGLVAALAFGTFRRSRFCAAGLLGFFVLGKLMLILETGRFSGIFVAGLFAWYMLGGMLATFSYQARLRDWKVVERRLGLLPGKP
jgi:hypothetical protein